MDISLKYCPSEAAEEISVDLPFSKSIVNRLAVIGSLAGFDTEVDRYSSCEDTDIILRALRTSGNECYAGASGTALRFLLSYFAFKGKEMTITGTERLCQRPVGELTEKLSQLGAKICFEGKEGFPPVTLLGGKLEGGIVCFDNPGVSSQYISSLMLVAPYLKNGLTIRLPEGQVSAPYIRMTAQVMQAFGAKVVYDGRNVCVEEGEYRYNPDFTVPHDWSAASYWYEMASLLPLKVRLLGMADGYNECGGMQGDSRIVDLYKILGVNTFVDGKDIVICKGSEGLADMTETLLLDLADCPDIVPSFAVSCLLNNRKFEFRGVGHLRLKESDRIEALIRESARMGYITGWDENKSLFYWDGRVSVPDKSIIFETYNDHRISMSFAPAVFRFMKAGVRDAGNVVKSYKTFWEDMKQTGVSIDAV